MVLLVLKLVCIAHLVASSAPLGPWTQYIISPESRTITPTDVHRTTGNVSSSDTLFRLSGTGSSVTLDFGKEIGGYLSFNFGEVDDGQTFNLSFTESPLFIGPISDDSALGVPTMNYDGALVVSAVSNTAWTVPQEYLRGGFRYATLWMTTPGSVSVFNFSTAFTPSPHVSDLRDYSGYFWSNDDLLNRIWYAGVYTLQLCVVQVDTGRREPRVAQGWANDGSLGVGPVTIVDGAKRDRAVWPGDMGIEVPSAFVGTYDLEPIKNALATMVQTQNPNGAFAEAGPPLLQQGSDTYHGWTLIGIYNYYLYSGDVEFLETVWSNYTFAVSYLASRVGSDGLLNVTGVRDWGRLGQGGKNSEANAIYYRVLTTASFLASQLNQTSLSTAYLANATALKSLFTTTFWDASVGLFKDNTTDAGSLLHPQDANSLAVIFNLTSSAQTANISKALTGRWGTFGAAAPECPDTVSPFIGGFELEAHFHANATRALEMLRLEWGYAVNTNLSVQSSLLEGWTVNGSLYYRGDDGYGNDPTYTSHAHAWASGPTSLLSFYVVGLRVVEVLGREWSFAPNTGNLQKVQGGYETSLGAFEASYVVREGSLTGWFATPVDTRGTVTLPGRNVTIDGVAAGTIKGAYVTVHGVTGGNHSFVAK